LPYPPGNLATLHLERNILWPTRRGGVAVVHVGAEDSKTGNPIQFEIDADTVHLLSIYRRHYLPRLARPTGYLFPGSKGCKHIDVDTVTNRIRKVIRDHLGKAANAHLMRHLKAMRVLRDSNRNWELAADSLGNAAPARRANITPSSIPTKQRASPTNSFASSRAQRPRRSPQFRKGG